MRDLVQQVAEGHKNSKTATEKLQKLKQSIGMWLGIFSNTVVHALLFIFIHLHAYFPVKEVSEQSRELLRQALEEAHAELSRKFEIIREIHAIESLPHIRIKNFDDTEVSGKKKKDFHVL